MFSRDRLIPALQLNHRDTYYIQNKFYLLLTFFYTSFQEEASLFHPVRSFKISILSLYARFSRAFTNSRKKSRKQLREQGKHNIHEKSVKTGAFKDLRFPSTGSSATMPGATGPSLRLWLLAACGVATLLFFIGQIDHASAYSSHVPGMGIAMYTSAEWQSALQQSLNAVKHPFVSASSSRSKEAVIDDKYR